VKKFTKDPTKVTLEGAKKWLRAVFKSKDFAECPCCAQTVKHYKRKLNSGMARALIMLFRLAGVDGWVDVSVLSKEQRLDLQHLEYTRLRYWKLIEAQAKGVWRLTPKGRDFLLNGTRVPHTAFEYNKRAFGFSDDYTTLKEALGDHFDYDELMRS